MKRTLRGSFTFEEEQIVSTTAAMYFKFNLSSSLPVLTVVAE